MKKLFGKLVEISLIFIIAIFISSNFKVAEVNGQSMDPTLNNGDLLLVWACDKPSDQDIIILTTEGKEITADYIVKRYYEENSTNGVWVEGDNKNNSLDSRKLGEFDKDNVVGVVLFDITQLKLLK